MRPLKNLYSIPVFFLSVIIISNQTLAQENNPGPQPSAIEGIIENIVIDNSKYAETTPPQHFSAFKEMQSPRATMLLCSDSRVQMDSFDFTPENDIFVVRNIGNQMATTPGSIEYGVNNLHTPVLLIVGHSGCGAIKASYGDYSHESETIRHELDTLDIKSAPDLKTAVLLNINQQVEMARKKFSDKVENAQLIIVGGVYDFRDDYNQGVGHFIITNLNGETNPDLIQASPYFQRLQKEMVNMKSQ